MWLSACLWPLFVTIRVPLATVCDYLRALGHCVRLSACPWPLYVTICVPSATVCDYMRAFGHCDYIRAFGHCDYMRAFGHCDYLRALGGTVCDYLCALGGTVCDYLRALGHCVRLFACSWPLYATICLPLATVCDYFVRDCVRALAAVCDCECLCRDERHVAHLKSLKPKKGGLDVDLDDEEEDHYAGEPLPSSMDIMEKHYGDDIDMEQLQRAKGATAF